MTTTATSSRFRAALFSRALARPLDAASLAAFRVGFGVLMLVATLRFFAHGWIVEYFEAPAHFFSYWGFGWVKPWPGAGMQLHFGLMALCALGVALGLFYRASVVGFGLLFAYAHLIDKTNYLNHYYLVVCLCGLMACLPLHAIWSLDARRRPELRRTELPAWMLWALRAQLGLVYVFGGLAKLKPDWLLSAEPLGIWLSASSDVPLLGGVFGERWVAFALSWAGAAFDLTIVLWLSLRRARPWALLALLAFHLLTARLFQLGMFPYIMSFGSLLFLEPTWPRRFLGWLAAALRVPSRLAPELAPAAAVRAVDVARAPAAPRWLLPIFGAYFAFQLLMPLRHWLYPGSVCWTEQGYRFSWNVMLMEKNGSVDFRVVEPKTGRTFHASPFEYFTRYQTKMMAPQPDMVLEAAHVVAEDFRRRGVEAPEVYVDAFVSLNGRAMQRLIDPRVDLAREQDGLAPKPWILPQVSPGAAALSARLGGQR